ncbi:hypothetical protein COA01_29520 [Bacillus cereus]|uniref:hypothetical protein n=1 Tax=Bacillus cereus TaxID=1396 RepID=UPI000BFB24BD|nr:hypothetical protein [Bacillus cereus]PGP14506.1 hypothetical protein COA01_29520 [Bacillus cereus]
MNYRKLTVSEYRYLNNVKKIVFEFIGSKTEEEVSEIVNDSSFFQTLIEDKEFVFHYHEKYWARYVLNEYGYEGIKL